MQRRWASSAVERDVNVTLRFVDGRESRALNRRYRGRDRATNVLTFVYDDGVSLTGDIVLSAPVVEREARAQHKTLVAHYAHLVIHGMLHLQGYDHARDDDAARMEAREVALLSGLGYGDPYAAPAG
jgi:probable rRNA maturation factor